MTSLIFSVLSIMLVAADDIIMPPTSGAFFYSDFYLFHNKGYHSVPVQLANGAAYFYCAASTNQYDMGLYSSNCDQCHNEHKYQYVLGGSGKMLG